MNTLVIVGKFQYYYMPKAVVDKIEEATSAIDGIVFVVGLSELKGTRDNPFDFHSRKAMIKEHYPNSDILFLKDNNNDMVWSQQLDKLVSKYRGVEIAGTFDGVVRRYHGENAVAELDSDVLHSERQLVEQAKETFKAAPLGYRAGFYVGKKDAYPTVIPCVDIAVISGSSVLLARKKGEDKLRFIGGHADPSSASYETDACKELGEEILVNVDEEYLTYIGNYNIPDWRRQHPLEKVRTMFYMCELPAGAKPIASDDVYEVQWVKKENLLDSLIEDHIILGDALKKVLDKK